jgi:serine acetyltransferase
MQPTIALSLGDLVLVYAIPIAFLFALWLVISAVVFAVVRSSREFDFRYDVLHKFEAKKPLPSGTDRLSFLYVTKLVWGDNCVQAALLFRISSFFARREMHTPALIIYSFSRLITHADISPWATIGPGLYIYHGVGTVIGKTARVGKRLVICQGAAVGGKVTVGDDVEIWPGAKILGEVTIGDRSEVGANAVVIKDVPPGSIVFGIPARLAGRKSDAEPSDLEVETAASA